MYMAREMTCRIGDSIRVPFPHCDPLDGRILNPHDKAWSETDDPDDALRGDCAVSWTNGSPVPMDDPIEKETADELLARVDNLSLNCWVSLGLPLKHRQSSDRA